MSSLVCHPCPIHPNWVDLSEALYDSTRFARRRSAPPEVKIREGKLLFSARFSFFTANIRHFFFLSCESSRREERGTSYLLFRFIAKVVFLLSKSIFTQASCHLIPGQVLRYLGKNVWNTFHSTVSPLCSSLVAPEKSEKTFPWSATS